MDAHELGIRYRHIGAERRDIALIGREVGLREIRGNSAPLRRAELGRKIRRKVGRTIGGKTGSPAGDIAPVAQPPASFRLPLGGLGQLREMTFQVAVILRLGDGFPHLGEVQGCRPLTR